MCRSRKHLRGTNWDLQCHGAIGIRGPVSYDTTVRSPYMHLDSRFGCDDRVADLGGRRSLLRRSTTWLHGD